MLSHYPLKSYRGFRKGDQALASGFVCRIGSLTGIPGGTSVYVYLKNDHRRMPVRSWTTSASNLEPFIGPVLP